MIMKEAPNDNVKDTLHTLITEGMEKVPNDGQGPPVMGGLPKSTG
jgi:hypothetical protein